MVRINVGCGMSLVPGWINYDNSMSVKLSKWPNISNCLHRVGIINNNQADFIKFASNNDIRYSNVIRKIPHKDNEVDAIYSCHMIEHLAEYEAILFLKEAKRVLKPNGIIRIVVPDMQLLVKTYLETLDMEWFLNKINLSPPDMQTIRSRLRFLLSGFRDHKWMYDKKNIVQMLNKVGFLDAMVVPVGVTSIANPGELDLFERKDESLYCEAKRGNK